MAAAATPAYGFTPSPRLVAAATLAAISSADNCNTEASKNGALVEELVVQADADDIVGDMVRACGVRLAAVAKGRTE